MVKRGLHWEYLLLSAISMWSQFPSTSGQGITELSINVDNSTYSTDIQFMSIAIDTYTFNKPWRLQRFIDASTDKKLQNLGRGLAPCTLRIGGSDSNLLVFDNGVDSYPPLVSVSETKEKMQFFMTANTWDIWTNFTREVNWDLMFNLNIFMFQDEEKKKWDPTNARDFLSYSDRKGVDIPLFQLGNEVSSNDYNYGIDITPEELVEHFKSLRGLLSEFPRYNNSGMVGPDLSSISRLGSARNFLIKFIDAGGADFLNAIGQHQYYMNARKGVVRDFYNHTIMNDFHEIVDLFQSIVWSKHPGIPLWFTETSSAYGGGVQEVSNRYAAGFLWLDKLGVAAIRGISRVFRQTFYGSSYALVDYKFFPFPDYFLSVLFKRLVLGPVFNVTLDPMNPDLRVYAQCARTDFYEYPKQAIVVYYLNLANSTNTLSIPQFGHLEIHLFQLTAPDLELTSKYVLLNNKTLELENDDLPPMEPVKHTGPVHLGPLSFGFIVIPEAKVSLCYEEPSTTLEPTTETTPTTTLNETMPNTTRTIEASISHAATFKMTGWVIVITLNVCFILQMQRFCML